MISECQLYGAGASFHRTRKAEVGERIYSWTARSRSSILKPVYFTAHTVIYSFNKETSLDSEGFQRDMVGAVGPSARGAISVAMLIKGGDFGRAKGGQNPVSLLLITDQLSKNMFTGFKRTLHMSACTP